MGPGFSPLDEELQLWPGDYAPSLAEGATRLGTWVPFERLPELLRLFTGTRLSASTIQRITETAGAAAEAVQTAAVEAIERDLPVPPRGPAVLQVSVDGAMIPLRGKGEWTEVKTLAIGTVQPRVRGADGQWEVPVTELSYFSRRANAETFGRLATVETHRRGVETAGTVCGVVDGAEWCQGFLDLHRLDAVRILDFPHAAGYLAQVAHATFGTGTAAATTWLQTQCHALKHHAHGVATVLAAVRTAWETVAARGDAAALEPVDTSLAYLEKRAAQLAYATFQAQGYPIGSGIVESANKVVVEARLKGAGMHWAPAHVNPMLALRTIACADRWDEAWPTILQQVRHQHRATAAQRRRARQDQRARTRQRQQDLACHGRTVPPARRLDPPEPASALSPATPHATPPTPPACAAEPTARHSPGPTRPAPNHPWRRPFLFPKHAAAA